MTTRSGRRAKIVPQRKTLIACKPYTEMQFGAEKTKGRQGKITSLYSLNKDGMRALGRGDEDPPKWEKEKTWIHYHRSRIITKLVEHGVPLSAFVSPTEHKKKCHVQKSTPMPLVMASPGVVHQVAFLSYLDDPRKYKKVPGRKKTRWQLIGSFATAVSSRKNDPYVILVPASMYRAVLKCLIADASKTYLLTYEDALDVLADLYRSPEYYLERLAEYLGVEEFGISAGKSSFRHEGRLDGRRVFLCEFVSGDIGALARLRDSQKGFSRDNPSDTLKIVICFVSDGFCRKLNKNYHTHLYS